MIKKVVDLEVSRLAEVVIEAAKSMIREVIDGRTDGNIGLPFTVNDFSLRRLGSSSVLVYNDEHSVEGIFINESIRFARLGVVMYISPSNSSPSLICKKATDRLNEVFKNKILIEHDEFHGTTLSVDGVAYESYGNSIRVVKPLLGLGKSMLNEKLPHYIFAYGRRVASLPSTFKVVESKCSNAKCKNKVVNVMGGDAVCIECQSQMFKCDGCSLPFSKEQLKRYGNNFLCEKCAGGKRCYNCRSVHQAAGNICSNCNLGGFPSKGRLFDYHSGWGRVDLSNGSRFKVGIEIEKEDEKVRQSISTKTLVSTTGFVVERDGSLNQDSGFEMVSPIYPLDIDFIAEKLKEVSKYIDAKASKGCGGHIHVSDLERTPIQILGGIRGYLPLLYSMYWDRSVNAYCKAYDVIKYTQRGHRQAINVGDKTLEFRMFPAVENIPQLLFRLRLVKFMMENPQESVEQVGKMLFNKSSELYKLLAEKLDEDKIKYRAELFMDYSNIMEKRSLIVENGDVKDVLSGKEGELDKQFKQILSREVGRIPTPRMYNGASLDNIQETWMVNPNYKALMSKNIK